MAKIKEIEKIIIAELIKYRQWELSNGRAGSDIKETSNTLLELYRENRSKALEEVREAYLDKAKEYRRDGLNVIAGLMIDIQEIALELIDKLERGATSK